MKIDNQEMKISRVEIITREYNSAGQSVREKWEFYYPKEASEKIEGFKDKKK